MQENVKYGTYQNRSNYLLLEGRYRILETPL